MLLRLRLGTTIPRAWHVDLAAALAARPGTVVEIEHGPREPGPDQADRLFAVERMIHGGRPGLVPPLEDPGALDAYPVRGGTADLVIDLSQAPRASGERVWVLTYDGAPGWPALIAAVTSGRNPVAALREGDRLVAAGRLGTEARGMMLATMEDALARTTTLILAALDGAPAALPMPDARPVVPAPIATSAMGLGRTAAKQVARAVVRRLYRAAYHTPHWRVGWRRLDGPDVLDLQRHPDTGWTDLPDDGTRFYADPFPIEHEGQVTLFVEDYPHRTGRGIISAVAFGPEGPRGRPEPVLECPYHLSYPFVFARDGDMWMIPETSAAGTIELYRATRFPGGWVKEATLVSGVTAGDATLIEHGGRWWMFATVQGRGGSYSDALHLWSAPEFRGPWTPHRRNPVLIDSAAARPAGRLVARDGVLWRPVQDCRNGYGAALGLARVLQLDDDGYEQSVATILTAGPLWPGRWLHTLNSAGGLEFIDGSGFARRRWRKDQTR